MKLLIVLLFLFPSLCFAYKLELTETFNVNPIESYCPLMEDFGAMFVTERKNYSIAKWHNDADIILGDNAHLRYLMHNLIDLTYNFPDDVLPHEMYIVFGVACYSYRVPIPREQTVYEYNIFKNNSLKN